MLIKTLLLCFLALVMCLQVSTARQYQFIPGRCTVQPGLEKQVGGPFTICTFPPKHVRPTQEDINAVIQHIQSLRLGHVQ
ncbi:uncharacterized protein LOC115626631 [Scaptodrosophila lebanonensis]|uniref:Uncharacterized protein LOC115626631 n=1 Tax=Drosophila lebanonensis TaxID=7225 RepID=A0A6J2TSK2_DROLE|nr:uncharacterized protein LOC115626631 [Scaptodrosophila lebanonensis]